MITTRSLVTILLVVALSTGHAHGQELTTRAALGQGWTYLEKAGNLRMAEERFTAAYNSPEGKNTAEVYYSLAAVWWERRNAMAAYMWLSNAVKTAQSSHLWDGGPDHEWDRRIAGRLRYIERNFTVIKLRAPKTGKPLPPLSDPPPADPLQREFVDTVAGSVAEGVEADMAVQWLLLPNGTYWVGDDLRRLEGGEMDPAKSQSWDLPKDAGGLKKRQAERIAAIVSGASLAQEVLAKEKLAAVEGARAREIAEERAREEKERLAREETQRQQEEHERAQREAESTTLNAAEEEARRVREAQALDDTRRAEAERRARESQALEDTRKAEADRLARETQAQEETRRAREAQALEDTRKAEADRRARESQAEELALEAEGSRRIEENRRARAEEDARERRGVEEQQAAEANREKAWEEARLRAEDLARREAEEQSTARKQVREARQSPKPTDDAERLGRFHMGLRGGVGGVTVSGWEDGASSISIAATGGGEIDAFVPLKGATVALKVGASYTNLPLSGCSFAQTRGHLIAGHLGPRVALPIKGRAWFTIEADIHLGGGFGGGNQRELDACAEARVLGSGADPRYGVLIETEHGNTRLGYGELGWDWTTFSLGPDLEIAVLAAPTDRSPWFGIGAFLRHDQVFAILPSGPLWFRPDGPDSLTLVKISIDSLDSRAAMARFQFGLRGHLLF